MLRVGPGGERLSGFRTPTCHFDETKVENLGVTSLGHKDVGRLDVAVDDALAMCCIERVSDFDSDGEKLLWLNRGGRRSCA